MSYKFTLDDDKLTLEAIAEGNNIEYFKGVLRQIDNLEVPIRTGEKIRKYSKQQAAEVAIDKVETLLTFVVRNNQLEAAKILLDKHVSLESTDESGDTALQIAASQGNFVLCELLIKAGANVNARNKKGETPLHKILRFKPEGLTQIDQQEKIYELLVQQGADVNAKTKVGTSPLHLAATQNTRRIIKDLIARRADINAATKKVKITPFHLIVKYNDPEMVRFFIKNGADIKAKTEAGMTAVHFATSGSKPGNITELLAYRPNLDAVTKSRKFPKETLAGRTPLDIALEHRDIPMLDYLLQRGARIDSLNYPFFRAHYSRKVIAKIDDFHREIPYKLLKWLIEHRVRWSTDYPHAVYAGLNNDIQLMDALLAENLKPPTTLLTWAAEKNNVVMAKWLFDKAKMNKEVNLDWFVKELMSVALRNNNQDVLEFLFSRLNYPIQRLIASAANSGDLNLIKWLMTKPNASVEVDLPINSVPPFASALYNATLNGNQEIMEYLIDHGAKLDAIAEPNGKTILHAAATKDRGTVEYIYNKIRKQGKTPPEILLNKTDNLGAPPLMYAAGRDDVIRFLVERGAEVETAHSKGSNILHYIFQEGLQSPDLVDFLVSHAEHPSQFMNKTNTDGQLPIDLAIYFHRLPALKRLMNLGASCFTTTIEFIKKHCKASDETEIFQASMNLVEATDPRKYSKYQNNIDEYLLLLGPALNLRYRDKQTILQKAVINNMVELATKILDHALSVEALGKSIINAQDDSGNTALHLAANAGNQAMVSLLISKYAEIDAQNADGNTPLGLAVLMGRKEAVEALLQHDPLPRFDIRNQQSQSILAMAADTAKKYPESYVPYIYALLLCQSLKDMKNPDMGDPAARNAFLKQKHAFLTSLKKQIAVLQEQGQDSLRNIILSKAAEILSDSEKATFDPVEDPVQAYAFADAVTKQQDNPAMFQAAQERCIQLLIEFPSNIYFTRTESFPKVFVPEYGADSHPEITSLDETATPLDVDAKIQSEPRSELLSELQQEVFFKHYLALNKESQEKYPLARFMKAYITGDDSLRPERKERQEEQQRLITKLEKVQNTTSSTLLAMLQTIKEQNRETAKERAALEQQLQDMQRERDQALQKADRTALRLKHAEAEVKQMRESATRRAGKPKVTAAKSMTVAYQAKSSSSTEVKARKEPDSKPDKPTYGRD